MASFNHEEVGSDSTPGAGSTLLGDLLARLCPGPPSLQSSAIRKSLLISADMAHALHPNHAGLHEENHRPAMHAGLVIKTNSNQRYATEASTAFFVRRVAEAAKVPLQDFCVRQVRAYSFCAFFFFEGPSLSPLASHFQRRTLHTHAHSPPPRSARKTPTADFFFFFLFCARIWVAGQQWAPS
jgi:hypothetical protein